MNRTETALAVAGMQLAPWGSQAKTEASNRLEGLPALILLVCTGYLEELIFRGILQQIAVGQLGRWVSPLYTSILFAILHAGYRSAADVIFVFLVGLLFAWIAGRSKSLVGVTLAHGLTNITLFLVMPFWLGR
jgi:membrane protease YdiL (CAAX protease family)